MLGHQQKGGLRLIALAEDGPRGAAAGNANVENELFRHIDETDKAVWQYRDLLAVHENLETTGHLGHGAGADYVEQDHAAATRAGWLPFVGKSVVGSRSACDGSDLIVVRRDGRGGLAGGNEHGGRWGGESHLGGLEGDLRRGAWLCNQDPHDH